jgi:acetoacetyl-CoA synthetase
MSTAPEPLWAPSEERRQRSQMHDFMLRIAQRYHIASEWEALRQWSIAQRERFWCEVMEYAGVVLSRPYECVTSGEGMLGTRWFPGARLNYARHLLRFDDDGDAILFESELGRTQRLTRRELRDAVARFAAALRRDGVTAGDRVVAFMPNIAETVIAFLAAASLGAVWSSCSPDFGVRGVLDRFGQIEPAVLVAPDGYTYGGKPVDLRDRVAEIVAGLPGLRRLVAVPSLSEHIDRTNLAKLASAAAGAQPLQTATWGEYLSTAGVEAPPLTCEEVPFDHPLYILYSSGTTGAPKCIIHGHGGTLLQHAKEHLLHTDLRAGERMLYFTTCGWMMWNWLVSGLGAGATIVLYEGSPGFPDLHHLWSLAERVRINVFGASAKYLAACEKEGIRPGREHDLSALRCVLSTGSPLSPEQFRWVYEHVKRDVQLSSISGGTDIVSCFILGNPLLPVYAGEIQCRGLGMDVHAWDEFGRPVLGEKGELVCISPFPSQPVGFWNDPDGARYRKAYFEHEWRQPGPGAEPEGTRCIGPVWRHGDFIEITPSGGIIVYGRSDATLNPGGVRIGTAEIYRIVEQIPEVADSVVVGRNTPDHDVEIVLFVVLRPGFTLASAVESPDGRCVPLQERIRKAIADGATKRHVPRQIRQVGAIPYTKSGKKVELAVQQMIHGQEVRNRDALANPEALDEFQRSL